MNSDRPQQLDSRRLELREGWFFHFPSDDEVEIRASQLGKPHFRIKDKALGGWLRDALSKLDGSHPLTEILSIVPERERRSLENIVCALQRKFLYERSESPKGGLPNWLAHTLGKRDTAVHLYADAIAHAKIVVIGTGRLGRTIVAHLRELGGEGIVTLEPTGKQGVASQERAPRERESESVEVDALASKLSELQADLVILAMDYFAPVVAGIVNRTCLERSTRWLFCLVDGWNLYAGPCFVPRESGCFECLVNARFPDAMRSLNNCHSHESFAERVERLMNPAFCGLLAGLVMADVPNLLGRVPYVLERSESLLLGAQVSIDLSEYEVNLARVARLTDCAACAS